jgi:fatty acid desaturase
MTFVITNDPTSHYVPKLTPKRGSEEYIKLKKDITAAGILDRAYGYYALLATTDFLGFFFALYMLITSVHPLSTILSSMLLAYFSVHIGGLIHDAGHRSIFKSTFWNDVAGTLCAAVITFPYSTWKKQHNAHHANTNAQGEDPDLEIPFVFTEDEYKEAGGIIRFIRRYQMWLYYPLGSFVSITYRTKAFLYYAKHLDDPRIRIEAVIMAVGLVMWYLAPFVFFPFWKALGFFVIYNATAGFIMLSVFAPNHKGMPQIGKDTKISFLEQQIIVARNLRSNPLVEYVYLGLNYQIEHHLFPACPRNKLKKIRPYLLGIAEEHEIPYLEMGALESAIFILKDLNSVARA